MTWWQRLTGRRFLMDELTAMTKRAVSAEYSMLIAEEMRHAAESEAGAVQATFRLLLEPSPVEQCDKVRLHTREEAWAFAHRVENDSGQRKGTLQPYKCRHCPRHPVTADRIWHVTHSNPDDRGGRGVKHRRPRELGRIDPAQMAAALEKLGMKP